VASAKTDTNFTLPPGSALRHNNAMTRIDCHAHAFPTVTEIANKTASAIDEWVPGAWKDPVQSLGGQVSSLLGPLKGLVGETVKSVSPVADQLGQEAWKRFTRLVGEDYTLPKGSEELRAFREKLSPTVLKSLEYAMSAGLGPSMLLQGTLENLGGSMERAGLDRTVVIGAPPVADNQWLLSSLAGDERFIPVITLPRLSADAGELAWEIALNKAVDLGAKGFKIHVNIDGMVPEFLGYRMMFRVAEERGVFIIVHTGCFHVPGYKVSGAIEPGSFEGLLGRHPGVRVCFAHMNRDHPERAWDVVNRHKNVYVDTSWQSVETVGQALKEIPIERILLGSDWPLLNDELQVENTRIVEEACSAEQARIVMGDNAERFIAGS